MKDVPALHILYAKMLLKKIMARSPQPTPASTGTADTIDTIVQLPNSQQASHGSDGSGGGKKQKIAEIGAVELAKKAMVRELTVYVGRLVVFIPRSWSTFYVRADAVPFQKIVLLSNMLLSCRMIKPC